MTDFSQRRTRSESMQYFTDSISSVSHKIVKNPFRPSLKLRNDFTSGEIHNFADLHLSYALLKTTHSTNTCLRANLNNRKI